MNGGGHRHHFFHHNRRDEDDNNFNAHSAYGSDAGHGPYVSSDYDTGYIDHYNGHDDSHYGSGYNPGSDLVTRADGYDEDPDHQTGSAYNAGNEHQTGSGNNAGAGDYQKGFNAGKNYQQGYNASYNGASDYRESQVGENYGRTRMEEKQDKRMDHAGELGAMTNGGFKLFEKHGAKTDPAQARRHRIEGEIAGAAAVSTAGYALHEHQQNNGLGKASGGRKHHRRFF